MIGNAALEEQTAGDGSCVGQGEEGKVPQNMIYLVTSLLISRYL